MVITGVELKMRIITAYKRSAERVIDFIFDRFLNFENVFGYDSEIKYEED